MEPDEEKTTMDVPEGKTEQKADEKADESQEKPDQEEKITTTVPGEKTEQVKTVEKEDDEKGDDEEEEEEATGKQSNENANDTNDAKNTVDEDTVVTTGITDANPSRRSLKRIRAGWRALAPSRDFEKVFDDDSNPDYSSSPEDATPTDWSASTWAESTVDDPKPEHVVDDSPSRLEWLRQKREENEQNEHLDQLMSMVGLEDVKAHFLAVKRRVKECKDASPPQPKDNEEDESAAPVATDEAKPSTPDFGLLRLHMVLHGKDGVGKKTIARLYAQFLLSIGAVHDERFSKRSWRDSDLESSDSEKPTIIFYDEASSIETSSEMSEVIKNPENAVLIFSSRNQALLDAIEKSDDCLKLLPPPLHLPDYGEEELMQLLIRMMKKRKISVDGGFDDASLQVIVRRVTRERLSESFNNTHGLEQELDKACRRRALRLQKENGIWLHDGPKQTPKLEDAGQDNHPEEETTACNDSSEDIVLVAQDIIGPEPKDVRQDNESWQKLQQLIGLKRVKEECGRIMDHAHINYRRELRGMEPIKVNLNRAVLGPPGVGKTTVAQLFGQIIVDLGLVSAGKIMTRNAGDLIGRSAGSSKRRTADILEEAKGSVLIIDEAHMLYHGSSNGSNHSETTHLAAVDTLVANISAEPEEDRCVLLVGYDHRMEEMFNNSSAGLQRRFPLEAALRLDAYTEEELRKILNYKLAKNSLSMTEGAKAVAHQVLNRMRINPKFGNAGDVENLVNQAKIRLYSRVKETSSYEAAVTTTVLQPADIDPDWDRALRAGESRASLFKGFVGFGKIIAQFEGYQQLAAGMKLHDIDPRPHVPWNFVFQGPPGTGKTSTARKIGRIYYDMNLLSTDEVVTCSVTDLVGEYLGHTGPKVINVLEKGLGKVLFIDEAYRLAAGTSSRGGSNFHMEAVGELVDAMTKPRYAGNMVIILAGYTDEMEMLLRSNPGLRSRFPTHVTFPHLDPHSCLLHLKQEMLKLKVDLRDLEDPGEDNRKKVLRLFARLSKTRGWANGRDVETLARTIIGNVYMGQGKLGKEGYSSALSIGTLELIKFLQDMLRERTAFADRGKDKEKEAKA